MSEISISTRCHSAVASGPPGPPVAQKPMTPVFRERMQRMRPPHENRSGATARYPSPANEPLTRVRLAFSQATSSSNC